MCVGGGGGRGVEGEVQKRYLHKGKLNEKNHARQLTLKNVHAIALKKIHTRNFVTKKIPAARKFPPPNNFSNGPSLSGVRTLITTMSLSRSIQLPQYSK